MKRIHQILFGVLCALVAQISAAEPRSGQAERLPNVVLIYIDDLGYGDLGSYGCTDIPTPNIDRLAAEGVRFTASYITNPPCCPSRCSLMMGQYGQRFGKYGMSRGLPIPEDRPTLAWFLRSSGYVTGQIGKWDIGTRLQGPLQVGFTEVAKIPPKKKYTKKELARLPDNLRKRLARKGRRSKYFCVNEAGETIWLTDYDGDSMVNFMERHKDEPFFLYWSPEAVHSPSIEAPERLMDRTQAKGKRRKLAGAIVSVDDQVGKLLRALKKHGLRKNTLVIFSSDNGANGGEGGSSSPYTGGKGQGTQKEGWVRVPTIFSMPGTLPEGKQHDGLIANFDFYSTIAALAGQPIPEHCDGVDLFPYLKGERTGDAHEYLFWLNNEPGDAVRRHLTAVRWKDWRLYKKYAKDRWQLFDLKSDPREETDLAAKYPDVVKQMAAKHAAWAKTLAPLGKIPKIRGGVPMVPTGHGWAYASAKGKTSAAPRPAQPNIVLLLTDDLGWQDVKCYDIDAPCPMETPNIDALAKKGVKFWQAYSPAPTCAPTRCAIMSGIHPARAQKTHVVGGAPPAPHHLRGWAMMSPWYSGRMPEDTLTLARALKAAGYTTGHCGKWHMAISHNAFPQPEDVGFDWTRHARGATVPMRPHRMTGFATRRADDPFRLDEEGFPYHQNSEDALTFVREHKDRPFFLYYATWLVHTPIHTRSRALLDKYVKKLGVKLPDDPQQKWMGEGQTNPFYSAMVEQLDYYVGKLFTYLEQTDDPRWPGHKLVENTYVIFTSDNGGMEGSRTQIITDNYPLDRGKISLMEGGTRVPLIIAGPGIPGGVESEVMVNGLDFYPTILSLTGTQRPKDKHLDGCDLAPLLKQDPTDPRLVREANGKVRDTMVWHFPNSAALESTIRIGDYKLVRNYDHRNNPNNRELELYRLYKSAAGRPVRVDIEEQNNMVDSMPDKAREMNRRLTEILTEMKASYPYYNPHARRAPATRKNVCTVLSHRQTGNIVEFAYRENGARVVRANLIYTLNGGARYEEWFRTPAKLLPGCKTSAQLPKGTTHYFLNLIDENNFLRSYPEVLDAKTVSKRQVKYAERALKARQSATDEPDGDRSAGEVGNGAR